MDKSTASAWMKKYLKPVVVGVVALMSAATYPSRSAGEGLE